MRGKKQTLTYKVPIGLLACVHCGKYALEFSNDDGGTRITSHKCQGAWKIVEVFKTTFTGTELLEYAKVEKQ